MSDENTTPINEGLDRRKMQITEGAGLEDSRLNQDFVEFLKKWSTPILLVIVAAVASYVGLQKLRESRDAKRAAAFAEIDAQTRITRTGQDVLPSVLLRIAEDHAGQGAVPYLARLAAAEQYQVSAMKGLEPGSEFDPVTMKPKRAEDVITPARREELLTNARTQYQFVLDGTRQDEGMTVHAVNACFGLASVAEMLGQYDQAKAHYETARSLVKDKHYEGIENLIKQRIESLDTLKIAMPLPSEASVKSFVKAAPVPQAPTPTINFDPASSLLNPGQGGSSVPSLLPPAVPTIPSPETPKPDDKPKQ